MNIESKIIDIKDNLLTKIARKIAVKRTHELIRVLSDTAASLRHESYGRPEFSPLEKIKNRFTEYIKNFIPEDYMTEGYQFSKNNLY